MQGPVLLVGGLCPEDFEPDLLEIHLRDAAGRLEAFPGFHQRLGVVINLPQLALKAVVIDEVIIDLRGLEHHALVFHPIVVFGKAALPVGEAALPIIDAGEIEALVECYVDAVARLGRVSPEVAEFEFGVGWVKPGSGFELFGFGPAAGGFQGEIVFPDCLENVLQALC